MELKDEATLAFAAWGALISTLLAVVRGREVFQDRPNLSATCCLTSSPREGNTIIISNASAVPVIVQSWELSWRARHLFRWKTVQMVEMPFEWPSPFKVGAHETERLNFTDEWHFDWGHTYSAKGQRLYMDLDLAGRRRPMRLLIWKG